MSSQSLVIAYAVVDQTDFDASYWLLLEQVDRDDDTITMSDAAELIDELYGTSACDDTSDTESDGAEEAETDEDGNLVAPVEEDEFFDIANSILEYGFCFENQGAHTEQVKVYRSHPSEPYKVVLSLGEVTQVEYQEEENNELLVIEAVAGINLTKPLVSPDALECGWVNCQDETGDIIPPPEITVSGSTLSWGRVCTGMIDCRYTSGFDLLTISIPDTEDGALGSTELLAYYHDEIYPLTVTPPDEDPTVDEVEKKKYCIDTFQGEPSNDHKQTCYKDVHHIVYCQCSNSESTASWDSEDVVPCPESFKTDSGRFVLGSETVVAGTTDCGELTEVSSADYYKQICCNYPTVKLPKCNETQKLYRGGKGLDEVTKRNLIMELGKKTKFIAVGPKDGNPCGYLITKQIISPKNCCEGVVPLSVNEDLTSDDITPPGGVAWITLDGSGGRDVDCNILTPGYYFAMTGTRRFLWTYGPRVEIVAEAVTCGDCIVRFDDGCSVLDVTIHCTVGDTPITITEERVLSPGQIFYTDINNAVEPVMWEYGDFILLGFQGSTRIILSTPEDFCGSGTITATDACGKTASTTIRSTDGYWADFDAGASALGWTMCSCPFSGQAEEYTGPNPPSGWDAGLYYYVIIDKYRLTVLDEHFGMAGTTQLYFCDGNEIPPNRHCVAGVRFAYPGWTQEQCDLGSPNPNFEYIFTGTCCQEWSLYATPSYCRTANTVNQAIAHFERWECAE